ncbi:MAG TPA: Gfo/Idh/MocA family oxidoreductase [Acidimicrobiales bacterium]|nr:Gfo/Idh/MocA family oxidoreductase [Acidimicrobiales bacterium]
MTVKQARVGLVGCGAIGRTHAEALGGIAEADFVACCDADIQRAQDFAERYGVRAAFGDPLELINSGNVDVVVICTPHPSHAPLATSAAAAGVHALVEKPIAVTIEEADKMIAAAAAADVNLGVIHQRRFWPAAQRMRAAIDEGKIGVPIYGECFARLWRNADYFQRDPWRGTWSGEGGGVLLNQAVHAVDLLQWFMGPVTEVYGHWANLAHEGTIEVEDTAVATLRFATGALAVITASTAFNPPAGFRVSVLGQSGATLSLCETPEGTQGFNDVWTVPGEELARERWAAEEAGKPGFPQFHQLQIRDFLRAVLEGIEPAVPGVEARKAIELVTAIYESERSGAPVHVGVPGSDQT